MIGQKTTINFEKAEKNPSTPSYKATVQNNFGATGRTLDLKKSKQQRVDQIFSALRPMIAQNAKSVTIHVSARAVSYTDNEGTIHGAEDIFEKSAENKLTENRFVNGSKGKEEQDESADTEEDGDFLKLYLELEELLRPALGGPLRLQPIEEGYKSCSKGEAPMVRGDNAALESLPRATYSDAASSAMILYRNTEKNAKKQEAALTRITALEAMIHPLLKYLKAQIEAQNKKLEDARKLKEKKEKNEAEDIKTLEDNLIKLRENEKALSVDRFGLYVAAAFAPTYEPAKPMESLEAAKTAAKMAQEEIQAHIDVVREVKMGLNPTKTWGEWGKRKVEWVKRKFNDPAPIHKNKEYSADAAALIFSSLPHTLSRMGASRFWHEQRVTPKQDVLEDELLRFVTTHDKELRTPMLNKIVEGNQEMESALTEAKRTVRNLVVAGLAGYDNAYNKDSTIEQKIEDLAKNFDEGNIIKAGKLDKVNKN